MAKQYRNHNIRFNMGDELAVQAWERLHSEEVEQSFKSQNAFVVAAINDYYERHLAKKNDPYLESREKENAFADRLVQSVEQTADGMCVHLTQKGKELTVTGEKVLCAIGRRAYFDGLFAADLTPELNGRRLLVDENYQTSIPTVYAIGDASSAVQLAHVAAAQGTDCVERMCGGKGTTDLDVIPSCIYSAPEIAVVGLTEAEAKEQGIPAVSGKCTLFSNARTIIEDPGRCFMKLVARSDTHEIVGAQLMCQHASDMISQLSTAMVNRLTAEQLLSVMRPHPSFEEALSEAVENLASKLA